MEVSRLQNIVVVMVFTGLILAVGILVFNKFESAVTDYTSKTDEIGLIYGSAVSLTQSRIQGNPTRITYANGSSKMTNTSVFAPNTTLTGISGTITVRNVTLTSGPADNVNVTYTYDAMTDSDDILFNMTDALAPIARDWMPLIVTIAVLAIILSLVITSFGRRP